MAQWFTRMYFDSRFSFSDDPLHRLFEVLHLCFLATAVVHIRSVDVMSNPSDYPDMFAYSLGLTMLTVMNLIRNIEIYFFVDGEPAAKIVTKRDSLSQMVQLSFYLAAAIVTGTQYFHNRRNSGSDGGGYEDDSHRGLFGGHDEEYQGPCSGIFSVGSLIAEQCGRKDRLLAETSDYNGSSNELSYYGDGDSNSTDVPVWLCLAGYLYFLSHLIIMVLFCFPSGGRHKEVSVPMNIDCE